MFSVQNWALVFQSVDYLSADASPTPLEHFWSLATEEQFYLVWPMVFLGLALLTRALGRKRIIVIGGMVAIAALSFAYCVWLSVDSPGAAYFNTGTRAWEFLTGAILCFAPRLSDRYWSVLTIVGWVLLGSSIVLLTPAVVYPGWLAAVPVLGTALVIWAGRAPRGSVVERAYEHPIVSYLASRSYAVYLWHWPALLLIPAAAGIVGGPSGLDPLGLLVVLGVSLVLAEASYRLLERRFRVTGVSA